MASLGFIIVLREITGAVPRFPLWFGKLPQSLNDAHLYFVWLCILFYYVMISKQKAFCE